jgi:formiminoglutamase
MDKLQLYTPNDVLSLVNKRDGETKLGEKVQFIENLSAIKDSPAQFVLLGIPEDIGVSANFGIAGTKSAWKEALKSLLNIQSNAFLTGEEFIILGEFTIDDPLDTSIEGLRKKVIDIDTLVAPIIEKIVAAGKTPIIVGGGHNNAAPIIAGAAKALQQPINVVNIDAHADLRNLAEGRHSGNGFTSAFHQGFIDSYRVFGLHQNYVSASLLNYIAENKAIAVAYFEDLLLSSQSIPANFGEFVANLPQPCGLEIDLDSIENILSSACSPSGFSLNDIRQILMQHSQHFTYLHICEGAVALADGRTNSSTGKTIAYLITDFAKAKRNLA